MRYCRSCRKWNTNWPTRCRYCRAGLEGRLCPAGHVNPPDSSLAFCGECGKPLEQKWGAGFSFKPYVLALGVVMLTLLLSFALVGQTDATFATAVMCLIIIIVGFRLAFRILPPWAGKFVADIIFFFTQILIGTSIKGRK